MVDPIALKRAIEASDADEVRMSRADMIAIHADLVAGAKARAQLAQATAVGLVCQQILGRAG